MTEAGLAFIIGSLIKFWRVPAKAINPTPEIFVAELADGVPAR
jgi:hypothetical protein